ncbi:hypothetical protein Scep_014577 [Stephania cephalantha]|uniref:DUF6857 domain-containing protein n=1 Tax=Stephania cephalantha TaxID=152367 RepID=A0AAP0J438_9MAGN
MLVENFFDLHQNKNVNGASWVKAALETGLSKIYGFKRFLKYLEDSLKNGFGFKEQEGDYEVASLLGQLKRVNQWLEDTTGYKFEVDETLERLKKKLYAFLLEHEKRKGIMKSHLSLGNLKG